LISKIAAAIQPPVAEERARLDARTGPGICRWLRRRGINAGGSSHASVGRSHANLPVWLIATSQGSTAAVNGAAHLGSRVSGAVLASSVTRPGHAGETLFDAEPGAITVPVLVVVNQYDSCGVSPPADAPNILAALTRTPRKELAIVASNQIARRADRCEGMSPHGYLGIEGMVVQRISDWIRMAGGR
jgi:hypothetical protein